MEVLASLAAGLKGGAAKTLSERDAAKRYLRLTKAQIISSLLSLGDWVSDWVYAVQALAWAAGEYIMNATEKLACIEHVSAHGPGVFDASGSWDGDESLGSGMGGAPVLPPVAGGGHHGVQAPGHGSVPMSGVSHHGAGMPLIDDPGTASGSSS